MRATRRGAVASKSPTTGCGSRSPGRWPATFASFPFLSTAQTLPKKSSLPEDIRSLVDRAELHVYEPGRISPRGRGPRARHRWGYDVSRQSRLWRTAGILVAACVVGALILYRFPAITQRLLASQVPQETEKSPRCTATAVSENGGYGYATGAASVEDAKSRAMRQCEGVGPEHGLPRHHVRLFLMRARQLEGASRRRVRFSNSWRSSSFLKIWSKVGASSFWIASKEAALSRIRFFNWKLASTVS